MTKISQRLYLSTLTLLTSSLIFHAAAAEGFNGPYIGAEAGLGILKANGSTIAGPFSDTAHSALVGGIIGYRTPVVDRFIVGVEGAAGLYTNGSDMRYAVYGTGGYQISDSGLAYLKVGYTWHDQKQAGTSNNIDGLTLGGGYEHILSDNLNLRLEYKRISYDDVSFADNTFNFTGHEITTSVLFNF